MKVGQRVRWYFMGSTNFEFHSPHWHGNVVDANHMRTDVGVLLPMGMFVADMLPDNPGKWLFHCHVSSHLRMGMQAFYTVNALSRLRIPRRLRSWSSPSLCGRASRAGASPAASGSGPGLTSRLAAATGWRTARSTLIRSSRSVAATSPPRSHASAAEPARRSTAEDVDAARPERLPDPVPLHSPGRVAADATLNRRIPGSRVSRRAQAAPPRQRPSICTGGKSLPLCGNGPSRRDGRDRDAVSRNRRSGHSQAGRARSGKATDVGPIARARSSRFTSSCRIPNHRPEDRTSRSADLRARSGRRSRLAAHRRRPRPDQHRPCGWRRRRAAARPGSTRRASARRTFPHRACPCRGRPPRTHPVRATPHHPTFGDCRARGTAPRVRLLVVPIEPPPLPGPACPARRRSRRSSSLRKRGWGTCLPATRRRGSRGPAIPRRPIPAAALLPNPETVDARRFGMAGGVLRRGLRAGDGRRVSQGRHVAGERRGAAGAAAGVRGGRAGACRPGGAAVCGAEAIHARAHGGRVAGPADPGAGDELARAPEPAPPVPRVTVATR